MRTFGAVAGCLLAIRQESLGWQVNEFQTKVSGTCARNGITAVALIPRSAG